MVSSRPDALRDRTPYSSRILIPPLPADQIYSLLQAAGIPTAHLAARRWLRDALYAVRFDLDQAPLPSPNENNVLLDRVQKAADRLIAEFQRLKMHPHAHARFWRYEGFRPIRGGNVERFDVLETLKTFSQAASGGRVSQIGRPPNHRKQEIINIALAFCVRFSPNNPSSDAANYFPEFAALFFETVTGLSPETKGNGIERQINTAISSRKWIYIERLRHQNENRPR